jgi:pyridoxamine 5'-phosphate oxidase
MTGPGPDAEALRRQLMAGGFDPRDAAAQPMDQFGQWFQQARGAGLRLPHAMTLATASADGRPSARMVLMTGSDTAGFVYYTDDASPKARATAANPWVALVFHWAGLERQVRVEGTVSPLGDAEAGAHWQTRAWAPRVAAWVARQSEVITDRAVLEERLLQLMAQHDQTPPPRPPHYRGFRVRPALVEFWQGRDDWLHDRVRYRLEANGGWVIERLAP